jgi:predicted phosphodiesterase
MRLVSLLLACFSIQAAGPFVVDPYLQLGDARRLQQSETLALLWHTADEKSDWVVEVKSGPMWKTGPGWKKMAAPSSRRVAVSGIEPHLVWRATLTGLAPGAEFEYRVLRSGKPVFSARGHARKSLNQPYRFVAFGDCAAGTPGQQEVAAQTLKQNPDFVFIPGDIVYTRGRIAEYREKFYPIYNSDATPLIRSIPFIAASGNHDTAGRDLTMTPDGLAYFYYWAQPLNGPSHSSFEQLKGDDSAQSAFRAAAGVNFPRMANFSFDYGNSHWLVLDSNTYGEWTDPTLRKWIADDLAATKATWKFVGFHHPGFNSSKAHRDEQATRLLSDVFETAGVDLVISGHVHNYQRSWPLAFRAKPPNLAVSRVVDGEWTLDKSFDGDKNTKPSGVIYLVTGAGGATLYNPEQNDDPSSWLEFTAKFVSNVHSLTVADVDGRTARFRQVTGAGDVIDSFTITK